MPPDRRTRSPAQFGQCLVASPTMASSDAPQEISMVSTYDAEDGLVVDKLSKSGSKVRDPYVYKGGEPVRKHINRTLEVRKSAWDKFYKRSKGRRSSGIFTSALEPVDSVAVEESSLLSNRGEGSHRSVFGWQTISPYSRLAVFWSVLMLVVDAVYTAFLVPITMAFVGNIADPKYAWAFSIDMVVGVIFLMDVFLNFTFGFVVSHNYQKKVVMEGKEVQWYYLHRGGAWIDFIAVIPFFLEIVINLYGDDEAGECKGICNLKIVMSVLRLVRLLRIGRFLHILFSKSVSGSGTPIVGKIPPGTSYAINVGYTAAVLVNFLGCLLFAVARWEGLENSWIASSGHLEDSNWRHYLSSIYWATVTITTVGYGEMTPVTAAETLVIMFIMIVALVGFGLLIGSASEVLSNASQASRRAERLRNKMVDVNSWLKSRKLGSASEHKIHAYYNEVWSHGTEFDEASLLEELPIKLRSEIVYQIVRTTFNTLDVFQSIDKSLKILISGKLVPITFPPGHEICRQGDSKDSMFIVQEGSIEGFMGDVLVAKITAPTIIGEDAVLDIIDGGSIVQPMTLVSVSPCKIWNLPLQDLDALFDSVPQLKQDLLDNCQAKILDRLSSTAGKKKEMVRSVSAITRKLEGRLKNVQMATSTMKSDSGNDYAYNSDRENQGLEPALTKKSWSLLRRKAKENGLKMASDVRAEESIRQHKPMDPTDIESLLSEVRSNIITAGTHGFVAFHVELKSRMEFAAKGGSALWEFKKFLAWSQLNPTTIGAVASSYCKRGEVSWQSLLNDLHSGEMTPYRSSIANGVFDSLLLGARSLNKVDSNDQISLSCILGQFQSTIHPDVQNSLKDAFQVTSEFLNSFTGASAIGYNDIVTYLSRVSMCLSSDDDFRNYCSSIFLP